MKKNYHQELKPVSFNNIYMIAFIMVFGTKIE